MQNHVARQTVSFTLGGGVTILALFMFGYIDLSSRKGSTERVGELATGFGESFGLTGELLSVWTRVHAAEELDIWVDGTNSIVALTNQGEAVQLTSYLEGVYYFDLFESGSPIITAELAAGQNRSFVYTRDENGMQEILVDKDIDGEIDKRITLDGRMTSHSDAIASIEN